MGRDAGPKCKVCRREGEKLFLKGDRCYTDKCAIQRKSYPPGEAGRSRSRRSQYRVHLREKQKARRIYRVREEQFKRYVDKAKGKRGATGQFLLELLERRLDNVLYRAGFASSRDQARQMVNHGHLEVNNRSNDIPSYLVEEGDVVKVKENSKAKRGIKEILEANGDREPPAWLSVNREKYQIGVERHPDPEEVEQKIKTNLIVEFYSR